MRLLFVDETGDRKFKDYMGLCVAWIDASKYPLLKKKSQKILENAGWSPDTEFKGSYLFSVSKGSTGVDVEKRIDAASQLLDLNASDKNSRMRFAYGSMTTKNKGADYIAGLPGLLKIPKVLPKPPKGGQGKNLVYVVCDDRDDVDPDELHRVIKPVLEEKGYVILERVTQATSAPETTGLMFADLVGYLVGRVDTISTDAELFEGLDQKQLESNGKIRKLKSSQTLIKKIKNLNTFIRAK